MATRGEKHEANIEKWEEKIRECRESGEGVKAWCIKQGLHPKTYRRWEKEIYGKRDEEKGKQKEVEKKERQVEFVSIQGEEIEGGSGRIIAEIRTEGVEVRIYGGAGKETVEAICRGVRNVQ